MIEQAVQDPRRGKTLPHKARRERIRHVGNDEALELRKGDPGREVLGPQGKRTGRRNR